MSGSGRRPGLRSDPGPPGLMSSCSSLCETSQKTAYLVQAPSVPRNFSGALVSHLDSLRSLIIMEHEGSVKGLQTENRRLRDKLQAVDSAVHGQLWPPESAIASSSAEPKEGGVKAFSVDDSGSPLLSRLSPLPSVQAAPGPLTNSEAKDESEEVFMTRGLRKALEELHSDTVSIKGELQAVSSLCTEVAMAVSALHANQGETMMVPLEDNEAAALMGNQEGGGAQLDTESQDRQSDQQAGRRGSRPSSDSGGNTRMRSGSHHTMRLAKLKSMNRLQRLVYSNVFELGSGVVILLNTFFMALQLQYDGFDAGHSIQFSNYHPAEDTWPSANQMFYISNIIFNALFTIELVLRYIAMQTDAFYSAWIWFDTFIVALGLADFFANEISDGGLGMDPTMIRVARLVRLVRMLKVFKTMTAFDSLFLLIKSIHASFHALVWSFLLLLSVQITAGMFLCQLLNGYIIDENEDAKKRKEVFALFGTFTRTMLTMFEVTLANWVPSCRTLIENVGEYYMIFYIVYRCMFCFAVLKVIAAVFITETNRVLASDDELTILKTRREKAHYSKKLHNVFNEMDLDRDGMLDFQEMQQLLHDEYMVSWLATLGFEGHDFEKVFTYRPGGDPTRGRIDLNEFLDRVGKAKGQAKQIDIFRIITQLVELQTDMAHVKEFCLKEGASPSRANLAS